MSLPPYSRARAQKSHPQVEEEDSSGSTDLQPPCSGPFLIRTYVRAEPASARVRLRGLAAPETLKPLEGVGIEPVGDARRLLGLGRLRLEIAHERLRAQRLHLPAGRGANGRVRRHDAHALPLAVLRREPLE